LRRRFFERDSVACEQIALGVRVRQVAATRGEKDYAGRLGGGG
jgi:hypothetical protein